MKFQEVEDIKSFTSTYYSLKLVSFIHNYLYLSHSLKQQDYFIESPFSKLKAS